MSQPRGTTNLDDVRRYMDRETAYQRTRAEALAAVPTVASELARYELERLSRVTFAPCIDDEPMPRFVSWDWARLSPSFDLQPAVIRQQPAVRMANRSLPNPNGENQL